jgi:hypothetical protein
MRSRLSSVILRYSATGTVGLENAHDRLEWVAMDTHDALDFLGAVGGMPMKKMT